MPLALCGRFGGGGGAPPPEPPTFAPDDVAGLVRWYESDYGVNTDEDGVYEWEDRSVSDEPLLQSTGAKKPAVVPDTFASGVDSITGDGSDDLMQMVSRLTEAGEFSFFAVVILEDRDIQFINHDNTGMAPTSTERIRLSIGDGLQNITANGAYGSGSVILLEVHRDAGGNITCFINGVDKTDGTHTGSSSWPWSTLCARSVSQNFHVSDHGAIFFYDNEIASGDKADVRTYLNDKYLAY